MVRPSTIGRVLAAAAVLMAATPSDAFGASTVKLSGTLSGGSLPRPAAGVSLLQALNLSDGTLAAAGYAPRGRYSLKVPPGPYALIGGSVFFKGSQPTVKLLGAVRARAGKSRRLALSLRKTRRRPGRAAAASPIVGVPYFTGGAPFQNRGVATMVETDLVQLNGGPPCSFRVVEVQRRDEVIREIRRQQTEFFDPATTVRPGHLLQPQILVKGTLTPQAGGGLSYAISVVNAGTGTVKGSTFGTIPESAFTTASEGIARELAKIICDDTALYVGQVSGTLRVDSPPGCSDHTSYSYSATLGGFTGSQDPFAIISGTDGSVENDQGAKGYSESGSGTYTLDPCAEAQSQGCSNGLHQASGSYGQVLFEREGSTVKAVAYTFAWEASASGCSGNPSEQIFGEGTFPLSEVGAQTITVSLSRHEDRPSVYDGSGTLTMQRVN